MDFLSFILGLFFITGFPVGCGLHSAKQIAKMGVKKDELSVWMEKLSPADREKMVRLKNIVEYWGRTLKYNKEISDRRKDEIFYINRLKKENYHKNIELKLAEYKNLLEKLNEIRDSINEADIKLKSKIEKKMAKIEGAPAEYARLFGNILFQSQLYSNMVEQTIESGYGRCIDFALLLQSKAKDIGLDMYLLMLKNHASCLYNINDKWYIADLTSEVSFSKYDGRKNLLAPNQLKGFVSEHHQFAIPLPVYLANFLAKNPDTKFHVQRYNLDTDSDEDVEIFDFLESYRNGTLHQGNVKYSLFD